MVRIEKFLRVGTRLTVKSQTGQPRNYTTTKEVIVGDTTAEECPLGLTSHSPGRGLVVRDTRADIVDCTVWYVGSNVRTRIITEKEDIDPAAFQYALTKIEYDIPASTGFSPCSRLYPIAIRSSLSCWLVRTGDMPWTLIDEMQERGALVTHTPCDKSATESLLKQAVAFMQKTVQQYVDGARETLESASAALDASEERDVDQETAVRACVNKAKALEKRLETYRKQMSEGSEKMGISSAAWNGSRLTVAAQTYSATLRTRAHAYTRGAKALASSTDTTARALAASAANSTLPAEVMADALREAGDEAAGDEVSDTFNLTGHGIGY